jgi:hypothetical protein
MVDDAMDTVTNNKLTMQVRSSFFKLPPCRARLRIQGEESNFPTTDPGFQAEKYSGNYSQCQPCSEKYLLKIASIFHTWWLEPMLSQALN